MTAFVASQANTLWLFFCLLGIFLFTLIYIDIVGNSVGNLTYYKRKGLSENF